jgi:hypothetical protein
MADKAIGTSQASSAADAQASPIGALKQGLVVSSKPDEGSNLPVPRKPIEGQPETGKKVGQ